MSRRDTIIVAVLVNTGLLAVLFMMAMHTNSGDSLPVIETTTEVATIEPVSNKVPEKIERYTPAETRKELIKEPQETPVVVQNPKKETPKVSTPEEEYVEITVKHGDYLGKIAQANGVTVREIIRFNQLRSPKIGVGQVLKIPIKKKVEISEARPPRPELAEVEPKYYTLKSGDNPWKVAKQFHVRFDELLKLNDLDEVKARNLKPGDVLRVR